MPWFPFYGRDFFNDEFVKTLTLRGIGIYLYLLWHQWEHGSIPDVPECTQFPIVKSDAFDDFQYTPTKECNRQETTLEALERIHNERFQPHDQLKDRFINKRLEEVRDGQTRRDQLNQDRAKKASDARWMLGASVKQCSSNAQTMLEPCHKDKEKDKEREKEEEKKGSAEGKTSARSRRLDEGEFLDSLRKNPAYSHLNVDTELAKMDAWLSTRPGREKTRKFIVNWLNKIDKPVGVTPTPPRALPTKVVL